MIDMHETDSPKVIGLTSCSETAWQTSWPFLTPRKAISTTMVTV
jgi:hypothetical protein